MTVLVPLCLLIGPLALAARGIAGSPLAVMLRCAFGSWADRCDNDRIGRTLS